MKLSEIYTRIVSYWRDKMKKFKFSYNYKGVDKWVIIGASNEEDAYRRFVFAYMHCEVEEVEEG